MEIRSMRKRGRGRGQRTREGQAPMGGGGNGMGKGREGRGGLEEVGGFRAKYPHCLVTCDGLRHATFACLVLLGVASAIPYRTPL